jgi:hypothetical protein
MKERQRKGCSGSFWEGMGFKWGLSKGVALRESATRVA